MLNTWVGAARNAFIVELLRDVINRSSLNPNSHIANLNRFHQPDALWSTVRSLQIFYFRSQ